VSTYLLTSREEIEEHRRRINTIRSAIEYDVINSPHSTEFEELEVLLNDAVHKLDEIYDKLKEHVYAYDVTVTVTKRVYVKARDEDDAEQAAIDYAMEDLSPPIDWTEDGVEAMREEDEETTSVYDVEV
jgi:repressor of nif and glnA expression